jgi:hypothetical protein
MEIWASDEGHAVGALGSVFVSVWRLGSTVPRLKRLAELEQRVADRSPEGLVAVTVMEASAFDKPIGAEERAEASAIAKRFVERTRAGIYVIEGEGFRVALARSVIAGITLFSRARFPTKVVSTVPAGATWLASTLPALDAAALTSAIEEARRAIAPR